MPGTLIRGDFYTEVCQKYDIGLSTLSIGNLTMIAGGTMKTLDIAAQTSCVSL